MVLTTIHDKAGAFPALYGEFFGTAGMNFEPDLQKMLDGAQAAVAGLDAYFKPGSRTEQDAPLQTSGGLGGGLTWLVSRRLALSLEGGRASGRSQVNREEYGIGMEIRKTYAWTSLLAGRRGRILPGMEAWIQAGPSLARADLDFKPGGGWPNTAEAPPGRYRALLAGGTLKLGLKVKLFRGLGLALDAQASAFGPQDYVKPGLDVHLPVLVLDASSGSFVESGEYARANPGGISFRLGLLAPWGLP